MLLSDHKKWYLKNWPKRWLCAFNSETVIFLKWLWLFKTKETKPPFLHDNAC